MSRHGDPLDHARAVAEAVLYEGYLLYPYRASSAKNRIRWQFGVLGPHGALASDVGEESAMAADCLLNAEEDGDVGVLARFLQLQSRTVERRLGDGQFAPVTELECGATTWLSWDEAVDQEIDLGRFATGALLGGGTVTGIEVPGGTSVEHLHDDAGAVAGRVVRRRWPLTASLRLSGAQHEGSLITLRLELVNQHPWGTGGEDTEADRLHTDERSRALRHSLLSVHLVLRARGATFTSVIDPPASAGAAARACRNHRLWPVLTGREGDHDTVLAAPIILYDWPEVAEQSAGDLFDCTEIDELLSLRVMTMTDEEKRQARATDGRAAEIVDRCDGMPANVLAGLHGSTEELPQSEPAHGGGPGGVEFPLWTTPGERAETVDGTGNDGAADGKPWWDPSVDASVDPATDSVEISGVAVSRGSTVRLHPRKQADAQDLFFVRQVATVSGVYYDVDGETHLAVVLRDDPASELHLWQGRYLYFRPDEVEPLETAGTAQDAGTRTRGEASDVRPHGRRDDHE